MLRITELGQLKKHLASSNQTEGAFDTETTGLKVKELEITGFSWYDGIGEPFFVHFNFSAKYTVKEKDPNNSRKKIDVEVGYEQKDFIDLDEARPVIQEWLSKKKITCHNGKFDLQVIAAMDLGTPILNHDTMIMSYLLDVNSENGLKESVRREFKHTMTTYEEATGQKVKNINWNLVDWEKYGTYGGEDTVWTWKLREHYLPQLETEKLMSVYTGIEMPVVPILARMHTLGVQINKSVLKEMSVRITADIERVAHTIYLLAGCEFNIGSGKQLAEVLFDRLGCPVIGQTDKGARSTAEDTLKELAYRGYEIAEYLMHYSKLKKLQGTYIDAIPEMVDADGRLRGGFSQTGTKTGRFSSSQPNLQNQPNDKEYPVREAFVPKEGYGFIVTDWSQIEIRMMAHISRDPIVCEILRDPKRDLHQETADRIGKMMGINITRQTGKIINFSIQYGMSGMSLAVAINTAMKEGYRKGEITEEDLKKGLLSQKQGDMIVRGYYQVYNVYEKWCNDETERVKKTGYVRTISGRRRLVRELYAKATYFSGKRIVVSTKIQGSCGDLMKLGMIRMDNMFREKGYDANLLMVVHDEFVIECKLSHIHECAKEVNLIMENIYPICTVPITADTGCFKSWGGMKSHGGYIKDNRVMDNLLMGNYGNIL